MTTHSPSLPPFRGETQVSTWYVSERVVVEAGKPEQALAIGVDGVEIVALAAAEDIRSLAGAPLVDFGARPLLPAWVNGHVHLAMAPLRGITSFASRRGNVISDVFFHLERHLTEQDVYVFTKLGAYESLLAGVGEVWDHYYYGHAVARALLDVGLTGVVAPTLQDQAGPFSHRVDEELAATLCIQENPRMGRAGIRAALGPHATDTVSSRLLRRVADCASSHRLPIHLHLAQSAAEMEWAERRGGILSEVVEAFSHQRVLFAHGLFLSQKQMEALIEQEWILAFCPLSQVQFGYLGPAALWRERGGALTVGTDCVASNDALSVQRELPWLAAFAALQVSFSEERRQLLRSGDLSWVRQLEALRQELTLQMALEPEELLRIAWGAGLGARGGRKRAQIALGALANFQVLDPDAPELFPEGDWARRLTYGETSAAIHALVVGGKLVGEAGHFRESLLRSPDYRETLAEARRRREELLQRAFPAG